MTMVELSPSAVLLFLVATAAAKSEHLNLTLDYSRAHILKGIIAHDLQQAGEEDGGKQPCGCDAGGRERCGCVQRLRAEGLPGVGGSPCTLVQETTSFSDHD